MDAGYKTPAIAHLLLEKGIQPLFSIQTPNDERRVFKNMSMPTMSIMIVMSVREIRF